MIKCNSLVEEINKLSRELDVCKSDIKRLEKASGYNINDLTDLFLSKQVIINENIDSKRKSSKS